MECKFAVDLDIADLSARITRADDSELDILLQTRGNISELARRAELERTHLYRKLKGLGINPKDEKYR